MLGRLRVSFKTVFRFYALSESTYTYINYISDPLILYCCTCFDRSLLPTTANSHRRHIWLTSKGSILILRSGKGLTEESFSQCAMMVPPGTVAWPSSCIPCPDRQIVRFGPFTWMYWLFFVPGPILLSIYLLIPFVSCVLSQWFQSSSSVAIQSGIFGQDLVRNWRTRLAFSLSVPALYGIGGTISVADDTTCNWKIDNYFSYLARACEVSKTWPCTWAFIFKSYAKPVVPSLRRHLQHSLESSA